MFCPEKHFTLGPIMLSILAPHSVQPQALIYWKNPEYTEIFFFFSF